jgi:hypothetical protein
VNEPVVIVAESIAESNVAVTSVPGATPVASGAGDRSLTPTGRVVKLQLTGADSGVPAESCTAVEIVAVYVTPASSGSLGSSTARSVAAS